MVSDIHNLSYDTKTLPRDIYVLLSPDGSTMVIDPSTKKPWWSPNRMFAEHMAADLYRRQNIGCYAVDYETALASILRHPKNQPPKKS